MKAFRRILALLAAAFGIATLVAGGRVLAGADPGYAVYRPLLVFNTAMGLAYLVAAGFAWRSVAAGARAALAVFALNAAAFVWIGAVGAASPGVIATASIQAMSLRTAFWLFVWLALTVMRRRASG